VLEHLVEDYSGERYFIVGTNHESTKKFAWRRMGRLPPLTHEEMLDQPSEIPDDLCVNEEHDEDDLEWTNKELHGPGALTFTNEKSSVS
jgi:hypothetical protein